MDKTRMGNNPVFYFNQSSSSKAGTPVRSNQSQSARQFQSKIQQHLQPKLNNFQSIKQKSRSRYKQIHNHIFKIDQQTDAKIRNENKNDISQKFENRQTVHLEKLKMNISLCLREKEKCIQRRSAERGDSKNQCTFEFRKTKNNLIDNLCKVKHLGRNRKINLQLDQVKVPTPQFSMTIKELRPGPKQIFKSCQPISVPKLGQTYASYYQIVAVEKKYKNSKYFTSDYPQFFNQKNTKEDGSLKNSKILRRIGEEQAKNYGNRINFENGISPWNMHQEIHLLEKN